MQMSLSLAVMWEIVEGVSGHIFYVQTVLITITVKIIKMIIIIYIVTDKGLKVVVNI